MFSEQQIKDTISHFDEMTSSLDVEKGLLPEISTETLLKNITVTFKNEEHPLTEVIEGFLFPSQTSSPNTNLVLTEAQQITLKIGREEEQNTINDTINNIKKLFEGNSLPSKQALITLLEPHRLEPHRKLLFSPLADQSGNTLLDVAQQAYRTIQEGIAPADVPAEHEWKHRERKINIPFKTTPPDKATNNAS